MAQNDCLQRIPSKLQLLVGGEFWTPKGGKPKKNKKNKMAQNDCLKRISSKLQLLVGAPKRRRTLEIVFRILFCGTPAQKLSEAYPFKVAAISRSPKKAKNSRNGF